MHRLFHYVAVGIGHFILYIEAGTIERYFVSAS